MSDEETIEHFLFLFHVYGLGEDKKMTADAVELKQKVLTAVKQIVKEYANV